MRGVKAPVNCSGEFAYFSLATYLDLSYLDTSQVTNMNNMFFYTGYAGRQIPLFTMKGLEKWDTSKVEDMSFMFRYTGRSAVDWSIGDLSNWNTSSVVDMSDMFTYVAYNTDRFDIGNIGKWDVSKVENMSGMFSSAGINAKYWSIGDLSNWDTSRVTNMANMFGTAGYLATTWKSIGTLKVYADNISYMFSGTQVARATLNIYNNPSSYDSAFHGAATQPGAGIIVNYSNNTTNIDEIIDSRNVDFYPNANVTKGSQLD